MAKQNTDIRVRMLTQGVSQRELARKLQIRHEYLCRVLAGNMTDNFRARILRALDEMEQGA